MAEEEQTKTVEQRFYDVKRKIARKKAELEELELDLEQLETQVDFVDEVKESHKIVKR